MLTFRLESRWSKASVGSSRFNFNALCDGKKIKQTMMNWNCFTGAEAELLNASLDLIRKHFVQLEAQRASLLHPDPSRNDPFLWKLFVSA